VKAVDSQAHTRKGTGRTAAQTQQKNYPKTLRIVAPAPLAEEETSPPQGQLAAKADCHAEAAVDMAAAAAASAAVAALAASAPCNQTPRLATQCRTAVAGTAEPGAACSRARASVQTCPQALATPFPAHREPALAREAAAAAAAPE